MNDSLLKNMRFQKVPSLCITLILCTAGALADVIELAPFEVTGSRIPASELARQLITIDKNELEATNPVSTWDALGIQSVIQVEQAAGLGGNASLYLRGGEPNSAKVLIDGMDVGNIMDIRGGSYNFNGIGLHAIEEIHFLPGSRSAVYGSDALSGVISISTLPIDWENHSTGGASSLSVGQGGLFQSGISQDVKMDDAFIRAAASYAREDDWIEGSEFEAKRVNLGAASELGETTSIRITTLGSWIDRAHYPDDSGGPAYAVSSDLDNHETEQYGANIRTATSLSPDSVFHAQAWFYQFDELVDSPGVAPGDRDPFGVPPNLVNNHLERFQFSGHLLQQISSAVSLVYGASYLQEDGDSTSRVVYPFGTVDGMYSRSVATLSAFAEAGWQLTDRIHLNSAVRYDDVEDIEAVWTGRLESSVVLDEISSQLTLAWGSGFKKPTFFALGNPVVGNPDLLPEESDLYEFIMRTEFAEEGIVLVNSIFRQEYNNLIDFSEAPPPRMVNLNEAIMKGLSSRLEVKLQDATTIGLTMAYVETEVVDSEELLRNRPKWRAGLLLRHDLSQKVALSLRGTYTGSRLDSSIPTGTRELDSYFRVDAGINVRIQPNLSLGLFVDNILDEEYEELIGFFSPGLRVRARIRLDW